MGVLWFQDKAKTSGLTTHGGIQGFNLEAGSLVFVAGVVVALAWTKQTLCNALFEVEVSLSVVIMWGWW